MLKITAENRIQFSVDRIFYETHLANDSDTRIKKTMVVKPIHSLLRSESIMSNGMYCGWGGWVDPSSGYFK